jgi:hypothetical protein
MKVLLAVMSCFRDYPLHKSIREGWASNSPYSVKFFLGQPEQHEVLADEIVLPVPDGYDALTEKTHAILRWAMDNGFDHVVKLDTDSEVINFPLLTRTLKYDYAGDFGSPVGETHHQTIGDIEVALFNYISSNYLLSRKAAEIVLASKPSGWAEDMWVGQALAAHFHSGRIRPNQVKGLFLHRGRNNKKCRVCLTPTGEQTFCSKHEVPK